MRSDARVKFRNRKRPPGLLEPEEAYQAGQPGCGASPDLNGRSASARGLGSNPRFGAKAPARTALAWPDFSSESAARSLR